jgi:hypothetical protein
VYLFRHITTDVPKKASGSRPEEQIVQRSNDLFPSLATRSIIAHETMHISLRRAALKLEKRSHTLLLIAFCIYKFESASSPLKLVNAEDEALSNL